jgi:hypothetical protein
MSVNTSDSGETVEGAGKQVWPEWVYPYSAGIVGGLLGGAAVAVVGLVYGVISGNTWLPVNTVAATVLRDMQRQTAEQLSQFDATALVAGTIIHLVTSIGLGLLFSLVLPALPGRPLVWGPVIGPLLWVGTMTAVLPILNPVMAANVEWVSFGVANLLYGLLLGWWIDRTPLIHVER